MRLTTASCLGLLAACGRLGPPLDSTDPQAQGQPAGANGASQGGQGLTAVPLDAGSARGPSGAPDAGPTRAVTLYPIVLAHGFAVSPGTPDADFGPILGTLQDAGFTAFADGAPAFDSVAVRGAALLATIEEVIAQTGAPAVNLIAHSMGGLDARYVASPGGLGRGDLIASITTIGTPHRGTAIADAVVAALPLGLSPILSAFSAVFGDLNLQQADVQAALEALSEGSSAAFNAQITDDSRVYYQSWAGVATATGAPDPNLPAACQDQLYVPGATKQLDPILVPIAPVVGHGLADWPNDGVVAVESAIWDDFHGCLPVDHLNETGDTATGAFPDPDPATGFDLAGFYVDVARGLAGRGD